MILKAVTQDEFEKSRQARMNELSMTHKYEPATAGRIPPIYNNDTIATHRLEDKNNA